MSDEPQDNQADEQSADSSDDQSQDQASDQPEDGSSGADAAPVGDDGAEGAGDAQAAVGDGEEGDGAGEGEGAEGDGEGDGEGSEEAVLAADALRAAEEAVAALNDETPADAPGGETASESTSAPEAAAGDAGEQAVSDADAQGADFPTFESTSEAGELPDGISLLNDVNLNVKVELGRTHMRVEDVLKLGEGCVVELDKLAGDPVDIYVNERLIARGEVLVLNDNFCIRVSQVLAPGATGKGIRVSA